MKMTGELPAVVREIVEQLQREKQTLQAEATRRGDDLRREADLQAAAVQSEADEKIRHLRDRAVLAAKALQDRTHQEIKLRIEEAIERLSDWQQQLAEQGQVQEAAAVTEEIHRWRAYRAEEAKPGPRNLEGLRDRVGESFVFEVTGTIDGALWGTDVYTSDSCLGKAAVHAGILRANETGTVRVAIVECLPNYKGTTRNGVTSSHWADPWHGAYRVERA
jgi:hypothetical protein